MFGYSHYFLDEEEGTKNYQIKNHNKKALTKSMHNQNEAQEITSIMMNMRAGLVRREGCAPHNAQALTGYLSTMKVGIVDRQGKSLSKEEYAKQMMLTVSLEAPQQEKKEQQQVEDIETTFKKGSRKRNKTPENIEDKENKKIQVKEGTKKTLKRNESP